MAYALLSAALYCGLLPLWEGFDELFHYGYVQHVAATAAVPMAGQTRLSRELWESLNYLPVSHNIQPYMHRPSISFDQYFHLSGEQRAALRRGADSLNPEWRYQSSPRENYEGQQPPLTYFLLAPVNALLANTPLITRVFILRLLLSFLAIPLLWIGTRQLAHRLGLSPCMEAACLLVVFSCQMFYATTCRISNDALAIPCLPFFLVAVVASVELPAMRRTVAAAFPLALGLLTKSLWLPLVPLAFVAPAVLVIRGRLSIGKAAQHAAVSAAIVAVLAGPWYVRNVLLYRSLSGNAEATTGVDAKQLFKAPFEFPWRASIVQTAHQGLWTGNNSFTSFSESTLNVVLGLFAVAIVLYFVRARRTAAELIAGTAIALYGAGLILIAVTFFVATQRKLIGPMPWYLQMLSVPVLALVFLGLNRFPIWGRWIAMLTVLVWAYVAAASWVAKLIPLYAGFEQPHARPRELLNWYAGSAPQRDAVLSSLCPAPAAVLYFLLWGVLAMLIFSVVGVLVRLYRDVLHPIESGGN